MSARSRLIAFGTAGALAIAGIVVAVLASGSGGQIAGIVLMSLGFGGAVLLVFYEVGLSEDHARAREEADARRREAERRETERRDADRREAERGEAGRGRETERRDGERRDGERRETERRRDDPERRQPPPSSRGSPRPRRPLGPPLAPAAVAAVDF